MIKRKRNLTPRGKAGSAGYDVHIGARKKHFDSHGEARKHALGEQNKGVHAMFVIVDSATGERNEYSRSGTKRNPKWTCKKRNPEAGAVEMREAFTGLPSGKTVVVARDEHVHGHLAALGPLVELKGKTVKGEKFLIDFTTATNPRKKKSIGKHVAGWVDRRAKAISGIGQGLAKTWINPAKMNPNGPVLLCSNESGTHLFIEGGDQAIDLGKVGLGELKGKESIIVGPVTHITYHARKKFDGKEEEYDYQHAFSEDSRGPLPMLRYDTKSKHLFLDGGVYHIPKPLFGGASQGITD